MCFNSLSLKRHWSLHVNTTLLTCFRLFTLKHLKTVELHIVTQVELYTYATNTYTCDSLGHRFHFDTFFTVDTNTICMHFRFDPPSLAFSNRCIFDDNAQRGFFRSLYIVTLNNFVADCSFSMVRYLWHVLGTLIFLHTKWHDTHFLFLCGLCIPASVPIWYLELKQYFDLPFHRLSIGVSVV